MQRFSETVALPLPAIERAIASAIDEAAFPPVLAEAIRYAALDGGKRLRPLLLIHACAAAGGDERAIERAMPAAAAIELIHAFSLVHDDLPALDDDDLRRGKPTLHVHAGQAMAILAGDAMLCLPFEVLASGDDAARSLALVRELAKATNAMIAGQVYDTLGGLPGSMDAGEKLEAIHRNKTGALIRAACRMGAVAAGADAGVLAALTEFGEHFGLIFQIVDDLLDVEQTTEHLGKRAGKDATAGKLTYPAVHGVEASRAMVDGLRQACLRSLETLRGRASAAGVAALGELAELAAQRTR